MSDNACADDCPGCVAEEGSADLTDRLAAVEAACTFTDDDQENAYAAMQEGEWQWFQWLMREKVRAALDAPAGTLAKRDARVRAAALREAAFDWLGEGRGVMFNRDGDDLTPAGRVHKWMEQRADRIEAEAATP